MNNNEFVGVITAECTGVCEFEGELEPASVGGSDGVKIGERAVDVSSLELKRLYL